MMKKFFLIVLAAASVAACQKDNSGSVATSSLVKISPVITKATETDFEDGDQIGLTIVYGDETYVENELLEYSGSVFSGSLAWNSLTEEDADLYAYYPYTSAGFPESFSVLTDQSVDGAYEASDFISSTKSGVSATADAVVMVFGHAMTKIVANITNYGTSTVSSVVLSGSYPTATIDRDDLTATVDENVATADITMQEVTASALYRAIVVPQTVAFTITVTTADGETQSANLTSTSLVAGGQYSVNVILYDTSIYVVLSGDIENWTDEGDIEAAAGSATSSAAEEHLDENYIIYKGDTYSTVTLNNGTTWMTQSMRYLPAGYTPSSDPTSDSHIWYPYTSDGSTVTALTDEESIATNGYLYDMYAILGGVEVTSDNMGTVENAQGICPDGWHVPNRAEYYDLVGYTNKNSYTGESSAHTNEDALFWDSEKSYATIVNGVSEWNYIFSGYRFYTSTPRYQATVTTSSTCSVDDWIGNLAVNYYFTSTTAGPNNSGVPQFFGLMSTFTSVYPLGRMSLAYLTSLCGTPLRCIRDHDIDFYAAHTELVSYAAYIATQE